MSQFLIEYTAAEAVRLPDGRAFKGPNCESNAARALLADGLAPDVRLVFCRDGKPALRGGIITFAGRMWAGAASDPAFRPYTPNPRQNAAPGMKGAAKNGVSEPGASHPTGGDIGASGAGGDA